MNQPATTLKPNCNWSESKSANTKIQSSLISESLETPFLIMDLDAIADNYLTLRRLMPQAQINYAIKASPAPEILKAISWIRSKF